MKFIFFLLSLSASMMSLSEDYDCNDIAVSPEGIAWDINNQGQMITGIVNCENDRSLKRTLYKNGFKNGKEYITHKRARISVLNTVNTYNMGTLVKSCQERSKKHATVVKCKNYLTGLTTTERK